LRNTIAPSVPRCLPPFGRSALVDALGQFPFTPRHIFSAQQQENISTYEQKIRHLVDVGHLKLGDVVAIAPDRREGIDVIYNQNICVNNVPTFTTQNADVMLLSVSDVVNMVPDDQRKLFRKLTPTERLTIQGFRRD